MPPGKGDLFLQHLDKWGLFLQRFSITNKATPIVLATVTTSLFSHRKSLLELYELKMSARAESGMAGKLVGNCALKEEAQLEIVSLSGIDGKLGNCSLTEEAQLEIVSYVEVGREPKRLLSIILSPIYAYFFLNSFKNLLKTADNIICCLLLQLKNEQSSPMSLT